MARVVVIGATGRIGRIAVRQLLARGLEVRALTRDAERARQLLGAEVEVHPGDVRRPASLAGLGKGMDAAVLALGTRSYYGKNGNAAVDGQGVAHALHALHADQVPHVVHLSAWGLERRSLFLGLFSLLLNHYFYWKERAERAVRASGIPYTIVRPVEFARRPAQGYPLLNQSQALSLARAALRGVSIEHVGATLAFCAARPDAISKTFELFDGGAAPLAEQLAAMKVDSERSRPPRTPLWGLFSP